MGQPSSSEGVNPTQQQQGRVIRSQCDLLVAAVACLRVVQQGQDSRDRAKGTAATWFSSRSRSIAYCVGVFSSVTIYWASYCAAVAAAMGKAQLLRASGGE
jgi:hypothetical protein